MNLLQLLATAPTLEINPVLPLWLLVPLGIASVAAVAWMYGAQRKLVPMTAAMGITLIRMLLVLLMLLLFLQPAFRWTQTSTSAGTLWLLVDQSPSMQAGDAQATVTERVRWAQATGRAGSLGRSQADYQLAELTAVASGFNTLRPATGAGPVKNEVAEVSEFASRLAAWGKQVAAVQDKLRDDPVLRATGAPDGLAQAAQMAGEGAAAARRERSLRAASDAVNWPSMQTNLQLALNETAAAAEKDDAAFERSHARDSAVETAAASMSNLTRADLGWMFLTSKEARSGTSAAELFSKYHVRLAGFSDAARAGGTLTKSNFADTLKSALAGAQAAGEGRGQSTNLATGLRFIADQIPADEAGAVVIVSDGRHNGPGDPTEVARLLASRGVRVYGLLTGSHEVSADAAVEQVDAPEWIYQDDTLRATAIVRLDGLVGRAMNVEFLRGSTLLGTRTITAAKNQEVQRVEFTDKPIGQPSYEYTMRVSQAGGDAVVESNKDNNEKSFRVAIKKDKLYALFIDDRPRWEYRYLAAYLQRPESPLKAQVILLSPVKIDDVASHTPAKASPANPRLEAEILPETREEWQAFDLIVLGDVPPEKLPVSAQQFIAAAVRDKGSTLITIAGQKFMPGAYAGTPLGELLPVTASPVFDAEAIARHTRGGFRPGLAPEGALGVLGQLGPDSSSNAALWSTMPPWYWHSPFTQAKPAASVLWSITEEQGIGAPGSAAAAGGAPAGSLEAMRRTALLASMPIGIGKSLYVASDQTWRLRQVYGTNAHDRFWGQVLRWAVGSDLPAGGKFVRFGASQQRYSQDQPAVIVARVLREDLTPYTGLSFSAVARLTAKGQPAAGAAPAVEARFVESPETPGYYRATLGGLPAGENEISLRGSEVERLLEIDPSVTQKTLLLTITPSLNLEQRNMNTDPAMLARIAQAGGGFSLDADFADVLAANLPAVERTQVSVHEAGFFSDPRAEGTKIAHWVFLVLFAALISAEWGLRKAAGLI
jgi:hypothetical protein